MKINKCAECGFIIKGKVAWFKCKKYHSRCLTRVKYDLQWENREKAHKKRWGSYHKKRGLGLFKTPNKAISQSR